MRGHRSILCELTAWSISGLRTWLPGGTKHISIGRGFTTQDTSQIRALPTPMITFDANLEWGQARNVVEKWSDPSSVLVDHEKDDFQPVAALLKAWSVPFDILRLDQQHLDASYLFDRSGDIRYGAVIWLADLPSYKDQNTVSLEEAAQ